MLVNENCFKNYIDDIDRSLKNKVVNLPDSVFLTHYFFELKSHCQRKPGGAKRLGSADFLYFFSIRNQADKINFVCINKISRLFTLEIDHPPCFGQGKP